MRLRKMILLVAAACALATTLIEQTMTAQEQPKPPIAKKNPKTIQIHGYTVTDEYAWMADKTKTDKDVLAYLKAETE